MTDSTTPRELSNVNGALGRKAGASRREATNVVSTTQEGAETTLVAATIHVRAAARAVESII